MRRLNKTQMAKAYKRYTEGESPQRIADSVGVHYQTFLKYLRQWEKGCVEIWQ